MTVKRNRRAIVLSLLLAGVSAFLAYYLIASRPLPAPVVVEAAPVSGEPVLIAARSLAADETLTGEDLEVAYVAPEAKGARALIESAQAIGQVALVDIPKGEQILAGSIGATAAPAPDTFASDVPVGMRAVAIAMEETVGAGGFVQPGDRVDVIASYELKPIRHTAASLGPLADLVDLSEPEGDEDDEDDPFPVAELLLQDVEVLAVGQSLDAAMVDPAPATDADADADTDADAKEASGLAARPEATSVTLLVNPTQALRLLLAVESEAIFRLLLRAPGDATTTELPPALITSGNIPMAPFALMGANLASTDVAITSARFRQSSVPAGGTLEFEATVQNVSPRLIPAGSGGAGSGHVYRAGQSWQSLAEPAPPGVYSVGVTAEHMGSQTYPWRWELGEDLAPGQSTTVSGGIQVPNTPGVQRWWFGTVLQPGTIQEDGVAPAEITIEPVLSVVVITPEAELRESPWPDAEIVSTVARGAQADVVEYQDGWFLVRANEREGWIPETVVANAVLPAAVAVLQVEEVETE